MKKFVVAGVAALALLGTSAVYAQHRDWRGGGWRPGMSRMSPEDRLAFVDARIAAVKAGLKLTPEQEKNWPAIETAVRDFAKQRIDRANASADKTQQDDPIVRLRDRADRMAATAAGLKRIADASEPLYKTLDDGQKRRLSFLTRGFGGHHRFGGWRDHDGERGGDHDRGRGMDRDGGSDRL
ncbi:MAG: Spy/CpxP family protein refolding chaperone [Pseudomonadota bacterium]